MLVLMWLGAASVTRAITSDAIFAPWRVVHEKRIGERAVVVRDSIQAMPPDHPLRWRKARRFEALVAWSAFPGCPWCVGWWVYGLAAFVAWLAMGLPAEVWGGPAWFTVPAVWQGGRWLYGIVAPWVDRT
jgi:hypothetical protein